MGYAEQENHAYVVIESKESLPLLKLSRVSQHESLAFPGSSAAGKNLNA